MYVVHVQISRPVVARLWLRSSGINQRQRKLTEQEQDNTKKAGKQKKLTENFYPSDVIRAFRFPLQCLRLIINFCFMVNNNVEMPLYGFLNLTTRSYFWAFKEQFFWYLLAYYLSKLWTSTKLQPHVRPLFNNVEWKYYFWVINYTCSREVLIQCMCNRNLFSFITCPTLFKFM